jgi:hypothetical protein
LTGKGERRAILAELGYKKEFDPSSLFLPHPLFNLNIHCVSSKDIKSVKM